MCWRFNLGEKDKLIKEEIYKTSKFKMENEKVSQPETDSEDEADMFCPALPPHLLKGKNFSDIPEKNYIVGPSLPPGYKPTSDDDHTIVPYEEENDEHDVIGPLPSTAGDDRFNVPEMEDRIKKLIDDVSKKDNKGLVRESWMLELPSDKPNILALGLGSRQFRKKNIEKSGDRSAWTDTPADKERKAKKSKKQEESDYSVEDIASKRRDEELAELVQKYEERKRSAPLIESHQKKKAKTEESKPKERKPFTREDDLQVNRFDEAQKETILKKARKLNDRFSSGNRKFL